MEHYDSKRIPKSHVEEVQDVFDIIRVGKGQIEEGKEAWKEKKLLLEKISVLTKDLDVTKREFFNVMSTINTYLDEIKGYEYLMEVGKRAKKRVQPAVNKMKAICYNLLSLKKITLKDVTFEEWYESREHETFYIFKTDEGNRYCVIDGMETLTDSERKHVEQFKYDYFYYGAPNYVDVKQVDHELTERQLAFESGDCSLHEIHHDDV